MVGYQFWPVTITELVALIFDDVFFSDVFLSEPFWGSSHILRIGFMILKANSSWWWTKLDCWPPKMVKPWSLVVWDGGIHIRQHFSKKSADQPIRLPDHRDLVHLLWSTGSYQSQLSPVGAAEAGQGAAGMVKKVVTLKKWARFHWDVLYNIIYIVIHNIQYTYIYYGIWMTINYMF